MTSVGVIAHSRKELGGGLGALRDALEEHGVDRPLWREVPKSKFAPKEVTKLLEDGVDLLFVWGGDGMVQRCVDAIGDAPVTLAILPAGTANLFASNLGIPDDLAEAVRIGFAGKRQTLDVGVVNGERFAVMAGTGVDALMISEADAGLKDRLGRFGYVITGVKAARHQPVHARGEGSDAGHDQAVRREGEFPVGGEFHVGPGRSQRPRRGVHIARPVVEHDHLRPAGPSLLTARGLTNLLSDRLRGHRLPLVEGTTPSIRGSSATASRSARASALNCASTMWCGSRPASSLR